VASHRSVGGRTALATVSVVALAGWSLVAVTWRGAAPATAAARPNIVFVIADDMRDDQLAGMPIVGSELVDEGVTFPNAFASRPLCCPSRVSILRGQYAHTTGIYTNTAPSGGYKAFRDRGLETSTLATWLDAAGYRTGLFGKYLNEYGPGNTVVPTGWDRWVAIDETNAAYSNYDLNIDGTITHFGTTAADYSTDVLSGYADAFIRGTPADTPLFAYVSYSAPHEPYRPSAAYANDPRCANATTTNRPSFNEADVSDKPSEIRNIAPLSASDQTLFGSTLPQKQCRALFSVDDGVGRVLDALGDTGRLGDTLIVFVSDNGLFLGEHRLPDSKGRTYEEAVNVPFVVRYDAVPGISGTIDPRIVANIDLAPTATDAAGLSITPGCPTPPYGMCSGAFDGLSLLPLLNGTAASWRSGILLESPNWCGIRTARYNFTRYGSGFEELYDLQADPYQLDNALFGQITPQEQATRDALMSDLRTLCSPTPPNFSFGSSSPPTISSFMPTSGAPGDGVTITGTRFSGATAVRFGSTPASFTVVSSTTVTATVPAGASSGKISVQTPGGTATSAGTFTVTGGGSGPSVSGFSPTSGPPGTSVAITGTHFTGATDVRFSGTSVGAGNYIVNSDTKVTAIVPATATTGPIAIDAPGGTAMSASSFAVTTTPPGTISAVQSKKASANGLSITATLASSPIPGNVLVAVVVVPQAGTPSFNTPSGWTAPFVPARGAVFWKASNGSEQTVTVNLSSGQTARPLRMWVVELAGVDTANAFDQGGSAIIGTTTTSVTAATAGPTSQAGDWAIAAVAHNGDNGGGSTATNGFAVLAPDTRAIAATKTVSVAGAVSTTISWATPRAGSWIIATFRAA
jgi:N-acetylglucosamine-6-sulfatase